MPGRQRVTGMSGITKAMKRHIKRQERLDASKKQLISDIDRDMRRIEKL